MKNGQPTKESQGKISWFLRATTHSNRGQSENRKAIRVVSGAQSRMPSSTKIGGGDSYRLRAKGQIRVKH